MEILSFSHAGIKPLIAKKILHLQIIDKYVFFYKKLGSAPSTKSSLISHENYAIIVLKVS